MRHFNDLYVLSINLDGSVTYIDVERLSNVAQNALTYAVQSSPGKQFGIGFGVGWYVRHMGVVDIN